MLVQATLDRNYRLKNEYYSGPYFDTLILNLKINTWLLHRKCGSNTAEFRCKHLTKKRGWGGLKNATEREIHDWFWGKP